MHHIVMCLTGANNHRFSFLFNKNKIHFGIEEFAIMTGLNCEEFIPMSPTSENTTTTSFKNTYFQNMNKLKIEHIKSVFTSIDHKPNEDLIKLTNLYLLEAVLLAKDPIALINMDHLDLLDNLHDFYIYQWGRVVFEDTMRYFVNVVKNNQTANDTLSLGYYLGGFLIAVLGFIFEVLPLIEKEKFAVRISNRHLHCVLNWTYTRKASYNVLETKDFNSNDLVAEQIKAIKEEMKQPYMTYFLMKHAETLATTNINLSEENHPLTENPRMSDDQTLKQVLKYS